MKQNLQELEKALNITLKGHEKNLRQALIHRSFVNEAKIDKLESNERLEFLGDAVLSLIVTTYVYKHFPSHKEGDLTNFRASLVKTQSLSQATKKLGLDKYILLGHGEDRANGRDNPSILADTFEAIIGAIFLEFGLKKTTELVNKILLPNLGKIISQRLYRDYKSMLQEEFQEKAKRPPVYNLITSKGPDHARIFTIGVYLNNELIAVGTGKSKQKAEQEAARAALEKYTTK